MHEADTMVTDVLPRGRHRRSSLFRRALSRMSLGAAAVLLTMVVGVLTAVATGLTGATSGNSVGLSAGRPPAQVQAGPTSTPTAGIEARPTVEPALTSEAGVDAASEPVADLPDPAPVADASPAAAAAPAPDPIPTVRQGDSCSAEGARGTTAAGKPTVCTGERGDGRTRWRHT